MIGWILLAALVWVGVLVYLCRLFADGNRLEARWRANTDRRFSEETRQRLASERPVA